MRESVPVALRVVPCGALSLPSRVRETPRERSHEEHEEEGVAEVEFEPPLFSLGASAHTPPSSSRRNTRTVEDAMALEMANGTITK